MNCTDPHNCICPTPDKTTKIVNGMTFYLVDKHMNIWTNVEPDNRPYEG